MAPKGRIHRKSGARPSGAGDGIRTGDNLLGGQELYHVPQADLDVEQLTGLDSCSTLCVVSNHPPRPNAFRSPVPELSMSGL